MAKLIVREICAGDIEAVAAGLRNADRDEVFATLGHTDIATVLRQGQGRSPMLWAIEVDGAPAGLFGVAHATDQIGVPWMLGTYALERAPKQLTKLGRAHVHMMLEKYATLLNYVDARNLKSVYWLARLGFKVRQETEPYGVFGMPFHRFGLAK